MPLDQQQVVKAQAHLNGKLSACPVCGSKKFQTGEIIMGNTMHAGGVVVGGAGVPMVQVVCGNCYNVMLFAATPMPSVARGCPLKVAGPTSSILAMLASTQSPSEVVHSSIAAALADAARRYGVSFDESVRAPCALGMSR